MLLFLKNLRRKAEALFAEYGIYSLIRGIAKMVLIISSYRRLLKNFEDAINPI